MKQETSGRVVAFTQSETKTKKFRHEHPISDELLEVMICEVVGDFLKFGLDHYYYEYIPLLDEFVDEHHPREEKRDALIHNLFWWRLLYDSNLKYRMSCIEDYIAENKHWLSKRPILISWLREWKKAVPKFYHVGYKHRDRVLVVTDIMEEKTLDVFVLDTLAIPPVQGEIVFGTLLPLGDSRYFPIIDFYHFDFDARKEIALHLHYYYEMHLKNSPAHEAFIHVLSAMLQIERFVFIDNQENTSSI